MLLQFGSKLDHFIVYEVFSTRKEAVADFRATPGSKGDVHVAVSGSLPRPSWAKNNALVGISGVSYVDGTVLVLVGVVWTRTMEQGSLSVATSLARIAENHLAQARAKA
ncbi:MAG TPA: hypothetical protein VG652_09880 [Gaiellaceae bacterium]|nr:hypothetical protein [Gaiellaceae bacterium]